jgi:amino acid adenylation domain-containing protein
MLYTSGSTGQPKGVLLPHRALTNYLCWCQTAYSMDQGSGAPVHTPLGFDLTITSLFPPLLAGRTAVLIPEDSTLEALSVALRTGDFSLVKLTPSHLEALSHKHSPPQASIGTRMFVIGGESLMGETLAFWRRQAPSLRLINEYGPTEATVGCCVYEVPAGVVPTSAVPIGRPISNVRLYVLDRDLQPVPIGVPGELHIAGEGLALGYHGRPEVTSEKFIPDPFSTEPGARLYKTGDLARYRSDGILEFLGRLDHQVKIRGFRIELGEIEATLAEHGAVREVVVAVWEAAAGDRRLVAYVVADRDAAPSQEQLHNFLKGRLPDYMLPARYLFLPAFPTTSNG